MQDDIVAKYAGAFEERTELRAHENNHLSVSIGKDGDLSVSKLTKSGVFARIYKGGAFGCASAQGFDARSITRVLAEAAKNADSLRPFVRNAPPMLHVNANGTCHSHYAAMRLDAGLLKSMAQALYAYASAKHPGLSCTVSIENRDTQKQLAVSSGISGFYNIVLGTITVGFTGLNKTDMGRPVSGTKALSVDRYIEEQFGGDPDALLSIADEAYADYEENLKAACSECVSASGGYHECILSPQFNGILAHEAVGHTCEGDLALMEGSVARACMGQMVASPLVSLTDFARNAYGVHFPINMPFDDEGTPAVDAPIIREGRLVGYMTNLVSAAKLGVAPTGNARASEYSDEPIVRMRNTCFHPGTSRLEDMIASIDNGYYFTECGGGNATAKGEFALNVVKGFEIVNGRIGKRIRPTVAAGLAWDALKTVTMVSNGFSSDKHCGICGKKQSIETYSGGAEMKLSLNIGGK